MEIISNNKTAVNTVEVEFKNSAEEFEAEVQAAFLKRRKNITVPGFRKGKATRKMIETHYGEGVFYDDAINAIYRKTIDDVVNELSLEIVDIPKIEVTSVGRDEGVTFKAEFTTKPEVNISDYKGIEAEKSVKTIGDEEINDELSRMQDRNARIIDVTDRAAQKGDTVVFDFEGFMDGTPFEGGKADNFSLELGSGKFIPGFEDQVEGKNIDEPFEVNVTFPENYNAEELAGKEAVFKCLIHEIKGKELPELDDEFAKDVSEFDNLEELKADLKKKLEEQAEEEAENKLDTQLNTILIEKLEGEIPEVMYENRINDMMRDWEYSNRINGITIQDYLKYTGTTIEQFRENFKEPATKQIKLRLALEKIADLENIETNSEEIEKHYTELAEEHNMELDKVKSIVSEKSLAEDIRVEKAFDLVKANAKIKQ